MDFNTLCSDITAETGGQDAKRDVVHWLMLSWSQNSRASAQRALLLRKFILWEFTNSLILTTININMAKTAPETTPETAPASSKNCSHAEIMHFLHPMEETLPTGKEEMKLVALKHAEVHPPGRSTLSLRRKLATLQRVKHPTGDPN